MRRLIVLLLALPLLTGCGSSSSSSSSAASTHGTTESSTAAAPTATTQGTACKQVPVPSPKGPQRLSAPTVRLDPHRTYTVTVATNCGSFAFALDVKDAPKTAASVYSLVKRGFFDGLTFHRVAAGFVIQGGDPTGTGNGGPGYQIVEAPPASAQYVRGIVAMAKTQADPPGASGSQFFVVVGQSASLPPDYALAGKVTSGLATVDAIAALPTNPPQDGTPSPAVVMSKVTVPTS